MFLFFAVEIARGIAYFDETESRHAMKSLRMTEGDTIHFTDGKGSRYAGKITSAHIKHMSAVVSEVIEMKIPARPDICLAFAPTKSSDRFEFMVEKCVEIGVLAFQPFISFHSDRKQVNTDRLRKIAFSAMKQSMQLHAPVVYNTLSYKDSVKFFADRKFRNLIAYCGEEGLPDLNGIHVRDENEFCLFIGPEGDFSRKEYEFALENGFSGVNLGPNRLRTETAGLIGCHWLKTMFY